MIEIICAGIGLIVGGVIVGLIMHYRTRGVVQERVSESEARSRAADGTIIELRNQVTGLLGELQEARSQVVSESSRRAAAEARLQETQKSLDEQRSLLEEAKTRLTETFKALSSDALRGNTRDFIAGAEQVLKPLSDTLERYETALREMETTRAGAYAGLKTSLVDLGAAANSLRDTTVSLAQAFRAPTVRGRWGEIMLQRVIELSGLGRECVNPQESVATSEGRLRPDVVVRLPGERCIVVDAKCSHDAYKEAMDAEDPRIRREKLDDHAGAIRNHMRQLAGKGYWKEYDESPDLVLMFIPYESSLSAALSVDPTLIEDGVKDHVILVTPTALVATLSAVAYSWQQQKLADNARQIAELGAELYERLCTFLSHFAGIGESLNKATNSYNRAVASWVSRLKPSAEKLKYLGAAPADSEMPGVEHVDDSARELPPAEDGNEETRSPKADSSPKAE
jgi:DNA recombination protein RmuC